MAVTAAQAPSRLKNHIAPKQLQRDFRADGPNQKWVADFAYGWTAEGWLYAAGMTDPYSRRISMPQFIAGDTSI